jgi:hypothetical protein
VVDRCAAVDRCALAGQTEADRFGAPPVQTAATSFLFGGPDRDRHRLAVVVVRCVHGSWAHYSVELDSGLLDDPLCPNLD